MLAPFLLFASVASAKVLDSVPAVPAGWSFVRDARPTDHVSLKVSLRQQRPQELEQVVLEVSTPGHPNYGMHLSRNELRSYTAPKAESVDHVTAWLREHGIEPVVDNDWITISTTVDKADALLDAQFAWYKYDKSRVGAGASDKVRRNKNAAVLRTLSYSVPDELVEHIDLVQPTTRFGQLSTRHSTLFDLQYIDSAEAASLLSGQTSNSASNKNTAAVADAGEESGSQSIAGCTTTAVTPSCLKTLYQIDYNVSASSAAGNLVAFASYLEEYARYSDLSKFQANLLPEAKGQNFSVTLINGGLNDQNSTQDSGEANLDLQYIQAISHPIPILEYSTGGLGPLVTTPTQPTQPGNNEPYLEFLTYLLALDDSELPQTLSTSYGEEEQSVPKDYALKVCNLFMQLGARGVSVLFSSGDSGPGNICVRVSDNKPYFEPTFPAGCPYVTSVGATYQTGPEKGVSFSSGGFSSLHPRPSWQDAAVTPYLESIGSTYSDFFNASNRGIPDVAAQGYDFLVYDKGQLGRLSGTSASAPVFSGVIALLNAARRAKGQSPLGFLNPWLYNNTAALTDITSGAGTGCSNRTYFATEASWNATAGWDPVTGLGTPNFPALLSAATQ